MSTALNCATDCCPPPPEVDCCDFGNFATLINSVKIKIGNITITPPFGWFPTNSGLPWLSCCRAWEAPLGSFFDGVLIDNKCDLLGKYEVQEVRRQTSYVRPLPVVSRGPRGIMENLCDSTICTNDQPFGQRVITDYEKEERVFASSLRAMRAKVTVGKHTITCPYEDPKCVWSISTTITWAVGGIVNRRLYKTTNVAHSFISPPCPPVNNLAQFDYFTSQQVGAAGFPVCQYTTPPGPGSFTAESTRTVILNALPDPFKIVFNKDTPPITCDLTTICGVSANDRKFEITTNQWIPPTYIARGLAELNGVDLPCHTVLNMPIAPPPQVPPFVECVHVRDSRLDRVKRYQQNFLATIAVPPVRHITTLGSGGAAPVLQCCLGSIPICATETLPGATSCCPPTVLTCLPGFFINCGPTNSWEFTRDRWSIDSFSYSSEYPSTPPKHTYEPGTWELIV